MSKPAFQVKRQWTLAVSLIAFPGYIAATTIVTPSLTNHVAQSDLVFTSKVLSGKCLLENCRESRPGVVMREYSFKCEMPIYGQCPEAKIFRSGAALKIGSDYVLVRFTDDGRSVYMPIELRENNSRIVYYGQKLFGVQLYKTGQKDRVNSDYLYYRLDDFISEVHRIKNVETR